MTDTTPRLTPEEQAKVRSTLDCTDAFKCRHCIEVGGGFSGERYRCQRCDETYYLSYEEMA